MFKKFKYNENMKNKKNYFITGFTLVELLVVIAVFAMLISLVIVSTGQSKEKARDARRESDIKQIQVALGLYNSSLGRFPVCESEVVIEGSADCMSTALGGERAVSGSVAIDPLGGSSGACGDAGSFVYCYQSISNGVSYRLRYHLEGNSISGKSAGWQEVGP